MLGTTGNLVRAKRLVLAFGIVVGLPLGAAGQDAAQVIPLEAYHDDALVTVTEKLSSLSHEFPEELYDWRPAEGIRSVREVVALIAAEGTSLIGQFGAPRMPGAKADFFEELDRLSQLSKAELLEVQAAGIENYLSYVRSLEGDQLEVPVRFRGAQHERGAVIDAIRVDMHEHLGQLIAYARLNGVVPPWRRPRGS